MGRTDSDGERGFDGPIPARVEEQLDERRGSSCERPLGSGERSDEAKIVARRVVGAASLVPVSVLLGELAEDESSMAPGSMDHAHLDMNLRQIAEAARMLSDFSNVVILAEVEGDPAGILTMSPGASVGLSRDMWSITGFYVRPKYRGNAVTRAIWSEAEPRIRSAGCQAIVLAENRRAVKLFEYFGFRQSWIVLESNR